MATAADKLENIRTRSSASSASLDRTFPRYEDAPEEPPLEDAQAEPSLRDALFKPSVYHAPAPPEPTRRDTHEEASLEPYVGKLERFELFSTNQCYYLVGCNKLNTAYRVLKMDRTQIERPPDHQARRREPQPSPRAATDAGPIPTNESQATMADNSHAAKPTLRPLSDFLTEDPNVYSQEEIKDMLDMIHDGNRMTRADGAPGDASRSKGGGLKPIVKAYGVVGFIRFLDCYYLTLITRRAKVGSVGGNGVYTIKNTETVPLKPAEQSVHGPDSDYHADPSSVLLSMWNRGKRSVGLGLSNREIAELRYQGLYQVVDLRTNFYFSYFYDVTRSLQENFLATATKPFPPPPFKDMYAWNYFLTREFEGCLNSLTSFHWIMPIIHGAFVQKKVNDYGRTLNLILIARRSRHFAGTRYLKRGVSEQGKVANDVEHEQILHDESKSASSGIFSSYLQVRGSIPTFWTQESSVTMPKPPIELNRVDPTYTATQLHFGDLMKRYSSPIVVLDLVKQSEKREREVRVGNEFRHSIDYINNTIDDAHKIRYCALDYSHISKHRNLDVSSSLNEVSTWSVNQTGFFCSAPKWKIVEGGVIEPFTVNDTGVATQLTERLGVPIFPMEQNGVLRTNCIDCLDRTNVAQFSAGVEAIGQQLVVMGIRSKAKLDPSSNIVRVLIDMYVDIGDSIALQYGGSEAHKKVSAERSESNIAGPIGKHKELLTSIRRYYSNAFTDRLKQDAMNLFLGYYLPYYHSTPLWEMESDYYLHNFHVKAGRGSTYSMKMYERAFGIEWSNGEDGDGVNEDSVASTPSTTWPRQTRPPNTRPMSINRSNSRDVAAKKTQAESKRISRVRNRCQTQNDVLSMWWKVALQSYVQQRMWMKLGMSKSESLLPPRYERLYQPEKIAQFDRFFARGWAAPVRRSHTAQQSEGSERDAEGVELRRVISGRRPESDHDKVKEPHEAHILKDFVDNHGFAPRYESSLKRFAAQHDISRSTSAAQSFDYIGSLENSEAKEHEEYLRYVAKSSSLFDAPHSYQKETVAEFKSCLHDYSLKADDVSGIRKLVESAHINKTILSGPYRGLSKDQSAIEVATTIHELFNALESMGSEGQGIVASEVKRRGLDKTGVKETVTKGWHSFTKSEKQYSEIVEAPIPGCRRSDLTTAESLKLYASMFDESTQLSTADLIFAIGDKLDGESPPSQSRPVNAAPRSTSFVKKAARRGITITSYEDIAKAKSTPLFKLDQRRPVPPGFEQINDDMFARKDNKFMVLNGAGVSSWHGANPITKISHVDDVLLSTLI